MLFRSGADPIPYTGTGSHHLSVSSQLNDIMLTVHTAYSGGNNSVVTQGTPDYDLSQSNVNVISTINLKSGLSGSTSMDWSTSANMPWAASAIKLSRAP